MTWWGAKAWANYLNSIDYGGSNQWRLPNSFNGVLGYNIWGNELGQLFYIELEGISGSNMPDTTKFNNEQTGFYWSSLEVQIFNEYHFDGNGILVWGFYTNNGFQAPEYKPSMNYTWLLSSGQIVSLPIPGSTWIMLTGLASISGMTRRRHKKV